MKRLTYEEMQSAIRDAGLSFEPWTWTEDDHRRVETVLQKAMERKGRNPDLPPNQSRCTGGHVIHWNADCTGFGVYLVGEFVPLDLFRLQGSDWREVRNCPVCGGEIQVLT